MKGKTKQLLFNLVQHEQRSQKGRKGMIIDSPGYGDANAPFEVRHGYRMMLNKYMGYGIRLNLICMCIDASKGVVQDDLDYLTDMQHLQKPIQIVLTKVDRLISRGHRPVVQAITETSAKTLRFPNVLPEIYVTSSKDAFGLNPLRGRLACAFEEDFKLPPLRSVSLGRTTLWDEE